MNILCLLLAFIITNNGTIIINTPVEQYIYKNIKSISNGLVTPIDVYRYIRFWILDNSPNR